jgi:hypothetical protein
MEGSGYNKSLQLLNAGDSDVDLTPFSLVIYFRKRNSNDGEVTKVTIDIPSPAPLGAKKTFTICNTRHDNPAVRCDMLSSSLSFNGNDAVMLVRGTGDAAVVLDSVGSSAGSGLTTTSKGWQVCAEFEATENRTLRRKSTVKTGNGGRWNQGLRVGSQDCEWEVSSINAWDDSVDTTSLVDGEGDGDNGGSRDPGTLVAGALIGSVAGVALVVAGIARMRQRRFLKRSVSIHYQFYGRSANGAIL